MTENNTESTEMVDEPGTETVSEPEIPEWFKSFNASVEARLSEMEGRSKAQNKDLERLRRQKSEEPQASGITKDDLIAERKAMRLASDLPTEFRDEIYNHLDSGDFSAAVSLAETAKKMQAHFQAQIPKSPKSTC